MGSVLIARNGNIAFESAYGLADEEWDIQNTVQTKKDSIAQHVLIGASPMQPGVFILRSKICCAGTRRSTQRSY